MRVVWYLLTSFVVGFFILAQEVLGFRILAPYFGYSQYVFASLIGVILFALAVGYFLGSFLADKNIKPRGFFSLFALAAAYSLVVSAWHDKILGLSLNLSLTSGTILTTFLLFAFPMAVMAAVSPYLIKNLAEGGGHRTGISAGSIYAVSTIGSLVGTFVTSFWWIPSYGANSSMWMVSIGMTVVAALWLGVRTAKFVPVWVAVLVPALFFPQVNRGVVASLDSPYAHWEIRDSGDMYVLSADVTLKTMHSYFLKNQNWKNDNHVLSFFVIPPLLNDAQHSLLLGLGAGTLPWLHEVNNPALKIKAVELDPGVVKLGQEHFSMDQLKNLEGIEIEDARRFLSKHQQQFDLIEIDLYQGSGEIPFYLATQEFFTLTKNRLAHRGLMVMNLYDPSEHFISGPILATIASVYEYTYYFNSVPGSFFVLASGDPLPTRKLIELTKNPESLIAKRAQTLVENLKEFKGSPHDLILTDDKSEIERLSHQAFKNY